MTSRHNKRLPELLAPAGSFDALRAAVRYGADAVYLGAKQYGLRAFCDNFAPDELDAAVRYAHAAGVYVYVTLNIFAYDEDVPGLVDVARACEEIGVDAAIVADPGVFAALRRAVPGLALHVSTQANTTNAETARLWRDMGAARVIPARELSMARLAAMAAAAPDPPLEGCVHGSMCASMSGRCVLSNHLTGRDATQGACAQPCRWKYALVEEKRPGEYMPVGEDSRGFYIYSAHDLCMIQHVDELCAAGFAALKIEGRMKTDYYVATVTRAYRQALDRYLADPAGWTADPAELAEVERAGHRPFTTGFYFGRPADPPGTVGTVQTAEYVARVLRCEGGRALVEQRNRFSEGETLTALTPLGICDFSVSGLTDEEGTAIPSAPHPRTHVRLTAPVRLEEGDILRRDIGAHKGRHAP